MRPLVALLGSHACGRVDQFPLFEQAYAGTVVGTAVDPGGFDQEPAGVRVTGLGDRALPGGWPEEFSDGTRPK